MWKVGAGTSYLDNILKSYLGVTLSSASFFYICFIFMFRIFLFSQLVGEVRKHRQLKIGWFDQHSNEALNKEQSPVEYLCSRFQIDYQVIKKSSFLKEIVLNLERHFVKCGGILGSQKKAWDCGSSKSFTHYKN